MSKLYWEIRKALGNKYRTVYIVTRFTPKMTTYPSNRWGYGYWKNKGRRNERIRNYRLGRKS